MQDPVWRSPNTGDCACPEQAAPRTRGSPWLVGLNLHKAESGATAAAAECWPPRPSSPRWDRFACNTHRSCTREVTNPGRTRDRQSWLCICLQNSGFGTRVTHISLALNLDRPLGGGNPSGGEYPANAVMTYVMDPPGSEGNTVTSWLETCTLPYSQQTLCTAVLNDFVARYKGGG